MIRQCPLSSPAGLCMTPDDLAWQQEDEELAAASMLRLADKTELTTRFTGAL